MSDDRNAALSRLQRARESVAGSLRSSTLDPNFEGLGCVSSRPRPPEWAQPLAPVADWLRRAGEALAAPSPLAPERPTHLDRRPYPAFVEFAFEPEDGRSLPVHVRVPNETCEYTLWLLARDFRWGRADFEPVGEADDPDPAAAAELDRGVEAAAGGEIHGLDPKLDGSGTAREERCSR